MLNQPSISFAANRLVWNVESKPNLESQKPKEEKKPLTPEKLAKLKRDGEKLTNLPAENPKELQQAEKALDQAYSVKEIPAELQKLNRQQIRNLERKNPEMLFKTCFSKVGEGEKLTPIENSNELKAGDKVRFSVEDAAGKNNNLEMGAGLRTLPSKFKVVQIGNEKFYRVYDGGPFVDTQGEYRAVRTHTKETIVLTDEAVPAEIKKQLENRTGDYARRDVNSTLDTWLAGRELTPELIDQFNKEMEGNKELTPEMQKVLKDQSESLKKFAEIWKGFNIVNYKEQIANIESRSSGEYTADNHGVGAKDPWNKRAIGRYQFTIGTLKDYGVSISNEADIAEFKRNPELQEKIMDQFTKEHIETIRSNPRVVDQIASGKHSIEQVLGAMHLGGSGALRKVEAGNLSGTDYFGTSYTQYMNRLEKPKTAVA
ncbi:MAG: hypothetical protein PHO48_03565 [Candidatus Gracilibacteria bacterium]|nr:hypothetical protein [Candidatus Gracilibacteria bacterium]MDD5178890.1 hypothetical protein [Candidatus Gracilibacteria bacterium]